MKVSSILIYFIMLQPVINSITGLSIRYGYESVFGPLFYFMTFIFITTFMIINKKSTSYVISLLFVIFYYLMLYFTDRIGLANYSYLIKVSLPFFLFLMVKNIAVDSKEYSRILNSLITSVSIYALLVITSFLVDYKIQPGKGYFGLIYAGNDLIVLFILTLFLLSIVRRKTFSYELLILTSCLLTYSKSFFVVVIAYAVKFVARAKSVFAMSVYAIISGALSVFAISFLMENLEQRISGYMPGISSFSDVFSLDFKEIAHILTFGRSNYLEFAFVQYQRDTLDYLIGLGLNKSAFILDGKVGIEMDFFDALNAYGLIGIVFLVLFYYIPMFRYGLKFSSLVLFLTLLVYSFFGGHFYNNPLVGVYYGVLLGLLGQKNKEMVRSNFEIRNYN